MVSVLTIVLAIVVKSAGPNYDFIIILGGSLLFCFGLAEASMFVLNKWFKKYNSNFLIFLILFVVKCAILISTCTFLLDQNTNQVAHIKFSLWGISIIIGLFQFVSFWINKNNYQRELLLSKKQTYLQYSFNALKSQNVIEFLQEALANTIELIKKDSNLAVFQIEKLTSILRYLLQSRDERYVKLGAELNNAREYCELAEIHLDTKVSLTLNVTNEFNETKIPPLVFQMVLDNQFKNFSFSKEKELNIEVYIENKKFVVVKTSISTSERNNYKNQQFINNLKQRYQLYNKASGVSELSTVDDYFVKFPLVIG